MFSYISYPKYESYESSIYRICRFNDGTGYTIRIHEHYGYLDLSLLKSDSNFLTLYSEIHKHYCLRFDCVIRYPFATPEIINITNPHLNISNAIIERVIPFANNRCEIVLQNDNNRYLINNYFKYTVGLEYTVFWYQPNYSAEYRYVDHIF